MHIIRNTLLLGAAVVVLPWAASKPQVLSAAQEATSRVTDLGQNITRDWGQDFRPPVVPIHAESNDVSPVVGLGNPGDHVSVLDHVPGQTATCPDGSTTRDWAHVTNQHTRTTGYVAACDLVR